VEEESKKPPSNSTSNICF